LFFYAAFPWLAMAAARRASAVLGAMFVLALAAAASPALVPATSGAATFLKCGPLTRLPEFVAGIALGGIFLRRRASIANANLLALAAVALVVAIVLASGHVPRYFVHAL